MIGRTFQGGSLGCFRATLDTPRVVPLLPRPIIIPGVIDARHPRRRAGAGSKSINLTGATIFGRLTLGVIRQSILIKTNPTRAIEPTAAVSPNVKPANGQTRLRAVNMTPDPCFSFVFTDESL